MVRTQEGAVLHHCTKFEADCSIRSKVIMGSQNLEIRSRDPGHAHLGVRMQGGSVLYVCTKFEADSCIRSNVIRIPKFPNWPDVI